jgi:hypothetical protein
MRERFARAQKIVTFRPFRPAERLTKNAASAAEAWCLLLEMFDSPPAAKAEFFQAELRRPKGLLHPEPDKFFIRKLRDFR